MFGLVGKGFAAAKRGSRGCRDAGSKLSLTGNDATRGLFASLSVDIAQLKSTSAVTRGHDRLRRKRDGPNGEVNRKGFLHVCPKSSVDFKCRSDRTPAPTAPL